MQKELVHPSPWIPYAVPRQLQNEDCAREHRFIEAALSARQMSDLATRLATIETESLDVGIADGLRELGETLQLDHAAVWRQVEEGPAVSLHAWSARPQETCPDLLSMPSVAAHMATCDAAWTARIDGPETSREHALLERYGVRSAAVMPLAPDATSRARRALAVSSTTWTHEWSPEVLGYLRLAAAVFGQALARREALTALRRVSGELEELRQEMKDERLRPRRTRDALRLSRPIVSESIAVRRALTKAEQVAAAPSTVLLLGETGVGKEVFAQAIHELSPRRQREMIRVSCAAIPSTLIENELFGHERGAYTGALERQIGRFELANHSTIFLDEIGELSPELQVKLLRVIEERVVERVGSSQPVKVDVRIIAATHRDLEKAVAENRFREDLFYRLNVFPIVVPPLRDRVEDIPGLVWQFVEEFANKLGKQVEAISQRSMQALQRYAWPGNVRELRNIIERTVIVTDGPRLNIELPETPAGSRQASMTLEQLQIEHIRATLKSTRGRVRGPGGAAERLGIKPTTLETRMAKYGVTRQPN